MTSRLPLIEFPRAPLDWRALFPEGGRRVQVEVGAGKGRFLIRAAGSDPSSCWVGLERRWSTLSLGVQRIVARGLTNALYIRCDAMEVLRRFVPPASVAVFHVYYPDPWWKKRHRKRRVFSPEFIADLARALEAGGELRTATDVPEYYEEILERVGASGLFESISVAPDASWSGASEPLTSYEAKYLQQGRRPLRAAFRRGSRPAPPPEPWISLRPPGVPLAHLLEATVRKTREAARRAEERAEQSSGTE